MMLTMTLHCIDSFFPSAVYNNSTEKQDRSEPRVLLIIPSAKTIGIIFLKLVVLSSYESYNCFIVFNIEFKDGFTLTKRWIQMHYTTYPTTKHMQTFSVLKALIFLSSSPFPSPPQRRKIRGRR